MENSKPQFHRRIFWDVDFDKLDFDKYANSVIERVFDRGDVDDIRQCRRYYGDEKNSRCAVEREMANERSRLFCGRNFK